MAITQVQVAIWGGAAADTKLKSYTNTPTQGNLLIAWCAGTTVATNASISGFTKAISSRAGSTASNAIFYKTAGAAESKDVTVVWTSSTDTWLCIAEYSGLTTPTLDKTAYTDTDGVGATSQTTGTTATTTASVELAVALVHIRTVTSGESWSNSFNVVSSATDYYFCSEKFLAATGAQETTLSWTTSGDSGGCIATFKAAAVVTTRPNDRPLGMDLGSRKRVTITL